MLTGKAKLFQSTYSSEAVMCCLLLWRETERRESETEREREMFELHRSESEEKVS